MYCIFQKVTSPSTHIHGIVQVNKDQAEKHHSSKHSALNIRQQHGWKRTEEDNADICKTMVMQGTEHVSQNSQIIKCFPKHHANRGYSGEQHLWILYPFGRGQRPAKQIANGVDGGAPGSQSKTTAEGGFPTEARLMDALRLPPCT